MHANAIDVLRKVALLADLPDDVLKVLASSAKTVEIGAREILFAQGEPGDALYVIQEGTLQIIAEVTTRRGAPPVSLNLATLGPNEAFGTLALIDDEPRSATAQAETDCRLLRLAREAVEATMADPDVSRQLLLSLTAIVRRMNGQLGEVAFGSVPLLVARTLLRLAERHPEPTPRGTRIGVPLTVADIASNSGLLELEAKSMLDIWLDRRVIEQEGSSWLLRDEAELAWNAKWSSQTAPDGDPSEEAAGLKAPSATSERPSREEIAAFLARAPLLARVRPGTIALLAGHARFRSLSAGETIFEEGMPGTELFMLRAGDVRIRMNGPMGAPITLVDLRSPDTFGELAVIDGEPRSGSATTLSPSQLIALHRDDITEALDREKDFAKAVLRGLADIVRTMNTRFSDVALLNRRARVCLALNTLMERHGRPGDEGIILEQAVTIADVAAEAGLYDTEVRRVIEGFQQSNILRRELDRWVILQPEVIEEGASDFR